MRNIYICVLNNINYLLDLLFFLVLPDNLVNIFLATLRSVLKKVLCFLLEDEETGAADLDSVVFLFVTER